MDDLQALNSRKRKGLKKQLKKKFDRKVVFFVFVLKKKLSRRWKTLTRKKKKTLAKQNLSLPRLNLPGLPAGPHRKKKKSLKF